MNIAESIHAVVAGAWGAHKHWPRVITGQGPNATACAYSLMRGIKEGSVFITSAAVAVVVFAWSWGGVAGEGGPTHRGST